MVQKKKHTIPPATPQAKIKARGSAEKVIKKGGGVDKLLKIRGKSTRPKTSFPIVGIGVVAVGVDVQELFLTDAPAETGTGFVIVQDLIQPNKDMSNLHGLHLPIDLFIPSAYQDHSGRPYGNSTY